ncbi:hypothetical protein GOARA_067_00780 [Gordonia araii NBRC 100433]|uniref:DUF4395 domain-containing protein n=1 Tax=Gordonia araii NBRC 100433 TaxID=1073574 RepID=G7H614_9ACTN|nr:DUF4395 domain-containing protein [Gordonia araii]NNG96969.1 DUF4395 domain-containing protein [Gordonia araii NBRC 100433]GAB11336.1 hypothetical protein GOARA_067_00780 [Gordonia araii NBRC 100433]
MASVREAFAFPNPVNDYAARSTAGLVIVLAVASIVVNQWWLYALLALGFALRVAGGPKYSPFGRLAVHVIVPKIWKKEKLVPGPPKRFAQTVGLVFGLVATVFSLAGWGLAAQITIGLLIVAAFLEFAFGICLGCITFGYLQRIGLVPESVCEACNNINLDRGAPSLDTTHAA